MIILGAIDTISTSCGYLNLWAVIPVKPEKGA
jgi:hypothetical protein